MVPSRSSVNLSVRATTCPAAILVLLTRRMTIPAGLGASEVPVADPERTSPVTRMFVVHGQRTADGKVARLVHLHQRGRQPVGGVLGHLKGFAADIISPGIPAVRALGSMNNPQRPMPALAAGALVAKTSKSRTMIGVLTPFRWTPLSLWICTPFRAQTLNSLLVVLEKLAG